MELVIKEYFPSELAIRKEDSTIIHKSSNTEHDFTKGMQRFEEEAQTLAKFNHPSIVKILGYFEANNTAYFVMEYEEGIDLSQYMKNKATPFTQEEILSIMMPILEGLKEVHRHNYLHRDIKPGNILLRSNKSPVLIDFGASKLAIGEASKSITSMLTEGYAPLEQYNTDIKQQGAFTDIYAIAAVIYKMITGEVPPSAQTRSYNLLQDGKDPFKSLIAMNLSGYDATFLKAVDRALAIKAKDRPQSVQEFQADIAGELQRNENNNTGKYISVIVLILLLILGGYFYIQQSNDESSKRIPKPTIEKVKDPSHEDFLKPEKEKESLLEEKKQIEQDKLDRHNRDKLKLEQQEKDRLEKEKELLIQKERVDKQKQVQPRNIGNLLRKGKDYYFGANGVSKDYKNAEKLFLQAAKEDSAEAYRYLGVMYLFGNGVSIDKNLAEELLSEAVHLGDSRAKELYACYIKDSDKTKYKVENLPSNETLNVRTKPSTSMNRIDEIDAKTGGIVTLDTSVNTDGTQWSKIKYCSNGSPRYGWVVSRYLVPAYTSYSVSKHYKVINISKDDTLNMRSGPGSEYSKISEMPFNVKKLILLECLKSTKGGRWCKVRYNTYEGWVSALYLREHK